jgi:ABC-2 type transport system permease protein
MNREQMRAILWLRWRLTRNQLMRGHRVGAVIAAVLAVFAVMAVVVCGFGATLVGALALKKAPPMALMFVWDGVTFFFLLSWVLSVLVELQRSETIDLSRLMHLPVALKDVFFLNYLASHLSLGMMIALPLMLGLALGLVIGRGLWMALLVPLVLCFIFMISAWVY